MHDHIGGVVHLPRLVSLGDGELASRTLRPRFATLTALARCAVLADDSGDALRPLRTRLTASAGIAAQPWRAVAAVAAVLAAYPRQAALAPVALHALRTLDALRPGHAYLAALADVAALALRPRWTDFPGWPLVTLRPRRAIAPTVALRPCQPCRTWLPRISAHAYRTRLATLTRRATLTAHSGPAGYPLQARFAARASRTWRAVLAVLAVAHVREPRLDHGVKLGALRQP